MEHLAENIFYGAAIVMLLCGCLLVWAAKRMEMRRDKNADMLAGLIFQHGETLSSQIHNQGEKLQNTRLCLTKQIQLLAKANAPNPPTKEDIEHRDLMALSHRDELLNYDFSKQFAA